MLFGVTTVERGTSSSHSAASTASLASGSPRPDASTGSSTSGTCECSATIAATARTFSTDPSTPILKAATFVSASRRPAWRATRSAPTA